MLRFRGEVIHNTIHLQLCTSRRFIRRLPYGAFPAIASSRAPLTFSCPLPAVTTTTSFCGASSIPLFDVPITEARRYFRAARKADGGDSTQQASSSQEQQQAGSSSSGDAKSGEGAEKQTAEEGGEKKAADGEQQQAPRAGGVKGWMEGLRRDVVEFPDIYNSANAINFILFTVFCLCSTGSNVEADWWRNTFGVDSAFKPLAWIFHSAVMDNFLSMTFAMMLLHTMCHSVLPTIGSRGLLMFCGIVGVTSGVLMWALQLGMKKGLGWESEKQFGPWDIVAGLMVMQFLHQGFAPWQILNSFNGWVRYACWVGAICICYYDAQPTVFGAGVGLLLCKMHPKFRVTGPVA